MSKKSKEEKSTLNTNRVNVPPELLSSYRPKGAREYDERKKAIKRKLTATLILFAVFIAIALSAVLVGFLTNMQTLAYVLAGISLVPIVIIALIYGVAW